MVKISKPSCVESSEQTSHKHIYNESKKNGNDEGICREGIETQRVDMWTQLGKERVGRVGRVALTYVHCHVQDSSLVGSCCLAQGTQLVVL